MFIFKMTRVTFGDFELLIVPMFDRSSEFLFMIVLMQSNSKHNMQIITGQQQQ